MAKYFLGSVGKAEAFRMLPSGELELAFVSKTLTDSGLNISTTKDDIRGGEGAPIQFSFYHDPNVEITLTDVQFKDEYITAQLGAEFDGDPEAYKTEELDFSTVTEYERVVKALPVSCGSGATYAVWGSKVGSDEWSMFQYEGGKIKLGNHAAGKYCIRYLAADSRAKVAEITSTIIPSELYLIITAPIFAGDACSASRGKAAGEIQFDVPRFLLNGGQEFAMNMSSNQTMNLSGIALSSESAECDANGGLLLKIREVIYDRHWYDHVVQLVADPDCLEAGKEPVIWGVMDNGQVVRGSNADLTFTPALSNGKFASGSYTIKITSKPTISISVTIA